MPVGVLVTVPSPVPIVETEIGYVTCPNVAVTDCALVICTTHALVPLHPAPLQPLKVDPRLAVAVSVTEVSLA